MLFKKFIDRKSDVVRLGEALKRPGSQFIVVYGRRRIGKSSLINMLVNRKDLVRVGNKPGMTQKINFFNINDEMVMVDLPGYGFAKVPLKLKEEFAVMIEKFITESENLKAILLRIAVISTT